MKRFLIFFVLVCAMFGVMLTTIRVVGTLVPRSRAMGILKINNCGQPCVMGIILGKTTFAEAKQLLTSYQVPQGYQITVTADEIPQTSGVVGQPILNVNLFYPDGSQPVQVHFVFYGQATVQGITVFSETYSEFMPSFADVVETYGTPACAVLNDAGGYDEINMPIEDKGNGWVLDSTFFRGLNGTLYKDYDDQHPLYWSESLGSLDYLMHSDAASTCRCRPWHGLSEIISVHDFSAAVCDNNQ